MLYQLTRIGQTQMARDSAIKSLKKWKEILAKTKR